MKNRILLAIALVGILVAAILWAIVGRAARTDPSRPGLANRDADSASPAIEAERAPAASPERDASAERADVPDPTRTVSNGTSFRGQVVDARTDEPVSSALARAEGFDAKLEAATDAQGRFASDARLPSNFAAIEFWNAHDSAHIKTAQRSELEWLGEGSGWLARIRIGPTYRLRLLGAGAGESRAWKLRVVLSAPGALARASGWLDVVPGEPPWARFDHPLPDAPEGSTTRIEVQNAEGTLRGSAPVEATVGIHPGVVTVTLDEPFARVLGRVVDTTGRPTGRAQVLAIPRLCAPPDRADWPSCRTDGGGGYALGGLAPGAYWVHARPRRGGEAPAILIQLPPGDTTAPDLVVPAETPAGAIEGLLKSRAQKDFPLAVVRLRAVDGRSFEHYDVVDTRRQSDGGDAGAGADARAIGSVATEPKGFFEFQQVPQGEYELTVISSDGREWSPSPLRVRPPSLELEIFRNDAAETWRAGFRVLDAGTGEAIEAFRAQVEMPDCWTGETVAAKPQDALWTFAEGARFRWNVHADGYFLASGTERDFAGTGDRRIADVRLRRGYGARLVLRDAEGRFGTLLEHWEGRVAAREHAPIGGAQVFADGELVATSDAEGFAVFETPRLPDRIEILAPGWTVLGSGQLRDGKIAGESREILVWLAR